MVQETPAFITTQLVITMLAAWTGRTAGTWGRKPLLLRVLSVSVRNGKDRRRARCRVGLDALGAVSRIKRSAALDSCDSSMAATGPDRTWRPPCF